jgi:SAM-dependent methyltransferase
MYDFYSLGPKEYYISRDTNHIADYEDNYWTGITDPDGCQRNQVVERGQHLGDIKQELEFINSLSPGRLLDIGCGLGFLLSGVNAGWLKMGVEISSFATKHARKWGQIFEGDLECARFPNDHFDLVVMHHVIEHIENPTKIIKEVYRILKCGGSLIVGTPDFDSGCARRFGANYRLLHDQTHISLFSSDSMHRFLRDHHFHIDKVEYPFFETRFFAKEMLLRLFNTDHVSPPFYGNFMTFYCHKRND